MPDLLVKLYDLPQAPAAGEHARSSFTDVVVRRAVAPEKAAVERWVTRTFGERWAGEAAVTFARQPIACFVAIVGRELAAFACYDGIARGFFGPLGVGEPFRRRGLGTALLLACLTDMRGQGYGYAIVGATSSPAFYAKACGATLIEGSTPGLYPPPISVA